MNQMVRSHVLVGEVLGEGDTVRVLVAAHPLRSARVEHACLPGLTIAEMIELYGESSPVAMGRLWRAYLNGERIPAEIWRGYRPKPGTTLILRAVAEGPLVAGLGAIIGAISSAYAAVSTFVAGLGALGSALLGTAVSIGFNFLINALFPPAKPRELTKLPDPVRGYSVSASRNQLPPFETIPVILGRHRVTPYYAAPPYSEVVGNDQYLRMLFVWGHGPMSISDIRIGETPLSSYEDVEIETFYGYASDAYPTLYPGSVTEEPLSINMSAADAFYRRTTAKDVIQIQLDFVLPGGLGRIEKKTGDLKPLLQTIWWRYRPAGTDDSAWVQLPDHNIEIATQDTFRLTLGQNVPSGQYDVEARIIYDHEGEDVYLQDISWVALRGIRSGRAVTFPKPLAMTAVRIRGSSQLNGALDTLNGITTSRVTAWSGSVWVGDTESSWPPDLYRHVLQGAANPRPAPTSQLDLPALQRWKTSFCVPNDFRYSRYLTDAASVYDRLLEICAAGRAVPTFRDGLWSVVWDEPDAAIVQVFTPRNSWAFEAVPEFRVLPHAWRVRFVNEEKDFIDDERIVYDDGYSAANATLFEGLEFPGVTNAAAVWKHGRFHIAQARLRPETVTINVDFENLIVERGDRVRLAHDSMLIGLASARVTAVDPTSRRVTIDEFVTMEPGKLYCFRARMVIDDQPVIHLFSVETEPGGETQSLLILGTAQLPSVGDLGTFGEGEKDTGIYRVLSIERQDELAARITLVDDAPGIALADKGAIPAFESNVTLPVDPSTIAPYGLRVTEATIVEGGSASFVASVIWQTTPQTKPTEFFVEAKKGEDVRRLTVATATARFPNLSPGVWVFRVRGVLENNRLTAWSPSFTKQILGPLQPAPAPEGFAIAAMGDVATLSWTVPYGVIQSSEIRYSPATAGATWATSTPIVEGVVGGATQVSFQSGTFLLKHVSYGGIYSEQAASVVVTNAGIQARNVVLEVEEMTPFDGTHDGTMGTPDGLELASSFDAFAVPDLFSYRDAFLGYVGFTMRGVYTLPEVTDLGEVFTSRLTTSMMAEGINRIDDIFSYDDAFSLPNAFAVEPEDWTVDIEVSTTLDDPAASPAWSEWSRLIVGDYAARAFRFRMVLRSLRFGITPRVTYLHVLIDMPDRVEAGRDVVVPVGGLRVTFNPAFRAIDGLSRSDQDLATGDRGIVSNLGPTGFDIIYRNASGTSVQRTLDWMAKGYGRKVI